MSPDEIRTTLQAAINPPEEPSHVHCEEPACGERIEVGDHVTFGGMVFGLDCGARRAFNYLWEWEPTPDNYSLRDEAVTIIEDWLAAAKRENTKAANERLAGIVRVGNLASHITLGSKY